MLKKRNYKKIIDNLNKSTTHVNISNNKFYRSKQEFDLYLKQINDNFYLYNFDFLYFSRVNPVFQQKKSIHYQSLDSKLPSFASQQPLEPYQYFTSYQHFAPYQYFFPYQSVDANLSSTPQDLDPHEDLDSKSRLTSRLMLQSLAPLISKVEKVDRPEFQEEESCKKEKGSMNEELKVKPELVLVKKKEKINIIFDNGTINDLLKIIKDYPINDNYEYNINLKAIHNIVEPLNELNQMIGMTQLKENIIDQVLYYIQDLHKIEGKIQGDYLHTVIYGPPGTGKTEVAKIIGDIFAKLGVLKNGNFKKVTRSDLIAGFLGQTAIKTRDVINECIGGVLFIDEAYSLGNVENKDNFSKECIDILCESLSNHKNDLMVIIAGYEEELNDCFFSYNKGLKSRFTWRFETEAYTSSELFLIFKKKVFDYGWKLKDEIDDNWFKTNFEHFNYYGRDIENFLSKVKIYHSRRIFSLLEEEKTLLSKKDLDNGLKIYIKHKKDKKENSSYKYMLNTMYV